MKKILIISFLIFYGCKKEETLPCNCGEIVDTSIDTNPGYQYVVSVKNSCSGTTKSFFVTYSQWRTMWDGDIFCASNITNW